MTELEKIIHRLHLVSDAEAPKLVAEFFNELSQSLRNAELADYIQKEAEYIRNIVPCWESLQTSLAEILCEPFPEDDSKISFLRFMNWQKTKYATLTI